MVELNTEYVGNALTATIDNQTMSLEMNKIIKSPTVFICNDNLNTVVGAPIDIDLLLGYAISDSVELIDEEDVFELENYKIQGIKKGFVNLKITSVSQQKQYYENKYSFNDGKIVDQLKIPLSIGEYLLIAEYAGDKYYEEASIVINFEIGKRNAICLFESETIQIYPNQSTQIGITLIDDVSGKKISNCSLKYFFNGYEYITQTNDQGYCNLNITAPGIDPSICPLNITSVAQDLDVIEEIEDGVYYYDDDGNIQYTEDTTVFINDISEEEAEILEVDEPIAEDNEDEDEEEVENVTYTLIPKYPLEIEIDSNTYTLIYGNIIDILLKTYKTDINYTITNNNYDIHIEGDVVAYDDDNNLVNVEYGSVSFDISELTPHPIATNTVDQNGHFSFDTEITETESNNIDPNIYEFSTQQLTEIELLSLSELTVTRNYALKHHVSFKAQITSGPNIVQYGMVAFVITKNQEEVYRYVTEIDSNGNAFFNFDVSTVGEYNIQVYYYSIFEYQSSESNILTYTIEDE